MAEHVHGSSIYDGSSVYGFWWASKMALNRDLGWQPVTSDANPYIKIDMLNTYTVIAFYLKSYENDYYLKMYDLKASFDGISYEYVGQNITTDFPNTHHATTYWFANDIDGRYWRIEPVAFEGAAFVKGDFIGYF